MTEPLEYWKRLAESRTENGEEIAKENATLKDRVVGLERKCAEQGANLLAAEARVEELKGELKTAKSGWVHAANAQFTRLCAAEAREAGLREALENTISALENLGAPANLCELVEARAALASTAEPIHAAPTKEQDNGSDSEVLRDGQEGVCKRPGERTGGCGSGDESGLRQGERAVVEVHAERLNQNEHHKPGRAEPVRGGQGVPPDVRAGVEAPVAADARHGSAAPPAQQPTPPEVRSLHLQEWIERSRAKPAPAQQPEGPDGVAFALSVRLSHANDARREAEAERDALKKQLEEAEASRERFRNWYEDKAKYNTTLQLDRNALRTERDALREKLQETERWAKERDTAARRSDPARKSYEGRLAAERARAEKLQRFKTYVHERLDAMGVPADPEPTKNAEHGCRIEGRLNYLVKENAALKEKLSRAREWTEDDVERVISDAQAAITTTLDNEARAVSKGSAPYADAFRRAALANNVADAIAAALLEIPPEGGAK